MHFDDTRFPLCISTFVGDMGPPEVAAILAHGAEILGRGRHVMLMDLRRMTAMPALQRQQVAEWNAANVAQLSRLRVGLAMVTTDSRERGIITAIYWTRPPPYPYLICESLAEAIVWCQQHLEP